MKSPYSFHTGSQFWVLAQSPVYFTNSWIMRRCQDADCSRSDLPVLSLCSGWCLEKSEALGTESCQEGLSQRCTGLSLQKQEGKELCSTRTTHLGPFGKYDMGQLPTQHSKTFCPAPWYLIVMFHLIKKNCRVGPFYTAFNYPKHQGRKEIWVRLNGPVTNFH